MTFAGSLARSRDRRTPSTSGFQRPIERRFGRCRIGADDGDRAARRCLFVDGLVPVEAILAEREAISDVGGRRIAERARDRHRLRFALQFLRRLAARFGEGERGRGGAGADEQDARIRADPAQRQRRSRLAVERRRRNRRGHRLTLGGAERDAIERRQRRVGHRDDERAVCRGARGKTDRAFGAVGGGRRNDARSGHRLRKGGRRRRANDRHAARSRLL